MEQSSKAVVRISGRNTTVPSLTVTGREIVVTGRWLKTASVRDEAYVQGQIVPDPEEIRKALQRWEVKPDLFTFAQKIESTQPSYPYYFEWDNFAVLHLTTYEHWLKNQVKKDVRENLRRAAREGVVVRAAPYDDAFVQGIKSLCDETPIRQGKRFWHHGKSLEAIREVHGTYCERAEYIGAYLGDEMIGFIKMVYVDNFAKTMHVIGKEKYFHKRTANALLAKAVEICAARKLSYFIYGEYTFPGKTDSTLSKFKQHHGFVEVRYPRYFVPLTAKGALALRTTLHRPIQRILPVPLVETFVKLRANYYRRKYRLRNGPVEAPAPKPVTPPPQQTQAGSL